MKIQIQQAQQQQWKDIKILIQNTNEVIVQKINIENELSALKRCLKEKNQWQFKDIIYSIGQQIYEEQVKIKEIYGGNFHYIQAQLMSEENEQKHKFFINLSEKIEPIECIGKPDWNISQLKSRIFKEYIKDPSLQLNDFTISINNSIVDENQNQQLRNLGQNCVIKLGRKIAVEPQIQQVIQNQMISYKIHDQGRYLEYSAPSNTSLGRLKKKHVGDLVLQNQPGNIDNYIFRARNMGENLNLTLQNIKDALSSQQIVFIIEIKENQDQYLYNASE